jgi:hypothetical protein
MLNIVPLFHAHQHERLLQFTLFDLLDRTSPFDDKLNRSLIEKMVAEYYIPAGELLLELAGRYGLAFRFALMISGSLLELLKRYSPRGIDLFRRIIDSGSAELLLAPCYSGLSALYDREEYIAQIEQHRFLLGGEFGVVPAVFFHDGPLGVGEVAEALENWEHLRVLLIGKPADVRLNHRTPDGRFPLLMCAECDSIDPFFRKVVNWRAFKSRGGGEENIWMCPVVHLEKMDNRSYSAFRHLVKRITSREDARLSFPSAIACEEIGDSEEYALPGVEKGRRSVKKGSKTPQEVLCKGSHFPKGMSPGELEKDAATALFSLIGDARRKGEKTVLEGLRRLSVDDHFHAMRTGNENAYLSFLWAVALYELAMTT